MASSADFFDPFAQVSYPWEFDVLKDWLIQYYRHLGRSPELLSALRAQQREFEMVPIPRRLHEQLLAADFPALGWMPGARDLGVSSLPGPGVGTKWPFSPLDNIVTRARSTEKLRVYPQLVSLVRTVGEAIEKGDVPGVMEHVAEDYIDLQGRGRPELEEALVRLVKASDKRRIVFVHAESFEMVDDKIAASVTGAWEAQLGRKNDRASEFFTLEIVFSKDANGVWKLASLKHV